MIQFQKKSTNHLITAYNRMMDEIRNAFEQADHGYLELQKALDLATYQVALHGEVTLEEAREISEYIKRDINDAAEYMMDASAEFYDWLTLDIEVIERKVIDLFLSVADHTRIELKKFKQENSLSKQSKPGATGFVQVSIYKSGEITGPGTLICENCGKTRPLLSSEEIKDCEACHHHRFTRRL